jgi:hypothetical protein
MPNSSYVECPDELPDVEGVAIVASEKGARYLPIHVERTADGKSWRCLTLALEGDPEQRIEIAPVGEAPLTLRIRYKTKTKHGPVAFYLAMESHGRTLDGPPG